LLRALDALDQLYRSPPECSGFHESGWKRVILHLHFATRPEAESEKYLNNICARPTQWDDSGPWSSNGPAPSTARSNEKDSVNGETVLWHMYEVFANVGESLELRLTNILTVHNSAPPPADHFFREETALFRNSP
jgi:hypothetical protein